MKAAPAPATSLGSAWLRAVQGPFPDVRIVATGGMDARNAREYLDAGARMVAVGSALADPEQIPLLAELV
ncbi:thiamine phosphate synthase [Nocardiopsis sp. RV163]|uniref:thiamine phosphate synthase n=1 Tax=Nocardiopsis sp. RV163 TaxID=1661388 RepID=UPI001F24B3C4|nr:thiamine phosphate synthase [Nocardiopsis sp. RV163]